MIPYLILIGVPGALALTGARRPAMLLFLVFLFYWVMIGFRFRVGMDWNNYIGIYSWAKKQSVATLITQREPGFHLLYWVAHTSGYGLLLVNLLSAAAFCVGLFAVARRCREPFLAIVVATPLLAVAFAMSATRQALAMGIIFFAYATWEKRSTFARVVFVLIAMLFHFSAVFVLVFVALAAPVSLAARLIGAAALGFVILAIINFAPAAMGAYSDLYVSGSSKLNAPGAIAQVGVLAAAALAYFACRKQWLAVNGENQLYRYFAIASLVAIPLIYVSSVGAYRFSLYFWPMAMYVWAGLPGIINNANGRAFYRVIVVAASIIMLIGWLKLANTSIAWLPYRNWLLEPSGVIFERPHRLVL